MPTAMEVAQVRAAPQVTLPVRRSARRGLVTH